MAQQPEEQWIHIGPDSDDVRNAAKFAVNGNNQKHPEAPLTYLSATDAWNIPLAEGYGILYLVYLKANGSSGEGRYHAIVWSEATFGAPMVLISFDYYGPATIS